MEPYSGISYSAGTKSALVGKPVTLGDHLTGIRNEIGELTNRIALIADRVSGGVPTGVEDAPTPTGNHMSHVEFIRKMLSGLHDQVNRLENVL